MVSYPADKFEPGVTPTQSDLSFEGTIQAVVGGNPTDWYPVTWGFGRDPESVEPVDAGKVLTVALSGESGDPAALDAKLHEVGKEAGIYFGEPNPLPDGEITELRLTGDGEASIPLGGGAAAPTEAPDAPAPEAVPPTQ